MYGFHGRLLYIDLTTQTSHWVALDPEVLRAYLGGTGLGTKLLYDYAPPAVDAFAPENPLIFTTAPLVDTGLTTTAKFAVVTTSPLTGLITDSLSSSFSALELKRCQLDAIVIVGRATSPVYLTITDSGVGFHHATHLCGKSAQETETAIRNEQKEQSIRIAAIGLAGERLVRFATISTEGRHAGRGGTGAVMGAKNLKAVALRGTSRARVADPEAVAAIADTLRTKSLSSVTAKYREIGTVANLSVFNRLGVLPTRNFQQSTFEHAEQLSGEHLMEEAASRVQGCAACTIRCERLFNALNGKPQRLEYETLFALGPLCGIEDSQVVLRAAQLCDEYGLDTISTGGTIAWAMECAEKNLLPDAQRLGLHFGNADAFLATITAIGERTGLGALLAEGSRAAAVTIGGEAEHLAMHVKGMELPGYEPRSLKTMALGLAVSLRGACHNRSGAYEADFSGQVDRFTIDPQRGALVAASEDFSAIIDSLIVCKFLRKCFTDFYIEAAEILSKVTGYPFTGSELQHTGERINVLKKLFNLRQGWQTHDDWLPVRLLSEPLPTGVGRGIGLTESELRAMIGGYYKARGWGANGNVPLEKQRELGIDDGTRNT
ncbi:MAG: aldehyde ferredoxin oxidoreductase family protein [Deltaproteobacteria bacterium]|nr:aldehyde ferredoxin oxidoreductase family protein [Deltaproteobacteria bacterium]